MIKQSYQLFRQAIKQNKVPIRNQTIAAVVLDVIAVGLLYLLNQTYGDLYQAIQVYNTEVIWASIAKFSGLAFVLVFINGYIGFYINKLAFSIREGLTTYFFRSQNQLIIPQLWQQRVQEDFRKFGEQSCDFWFAILRAGLKLPVFIGVIVTLTSWTTGAIIIAAVILGTISTRVVAKKLVPIQSQQETLEAQFRTQPMPATFKPLHDNFILLNKQYKYLAFTQSGLSQAFVLLPFIVLMPLYISKSIEMGAFFQSVNALGKIIDSLSILIDSRQTIVNIETCLVRLEFLNKSKVV